MKKVIDKVNNILLSLGQKFLDLLFSNGEIIDPNAFLIKLLLFVSKSVFSKMNRKLFKLPDVKTSKDFYTIM